MKGELSTLINLIFNDYPKSKNSISIIDSFDSTKDLFEALLMIFTKGMNILYGDKSGSVNLKTLSEHDFLKFQLYFQAIGIKPLFHHYHIYQVLTLKENVVNNNILLDWETNKDKFKIYPSKKQLIKYSEIISNNIEDMFFQLNCNNDVYIVYFQFTDKI